MKRLIIILLLFVMAGQATNVFYSESAEYQLVQDLDDKLDNENKEGKKEIKEFILPSSPFHQKLVDEVNFNLAPAVIVSSPVINLLTPPPDRFL